jgi:hypothetical protein
MIAPSMNVRMWQHPATQRNLKRLQEDGVQIIGPNDGEMACGEYGPGRMAEVDEILARVEGFFRSGPLSGRHVLVTSGPRMSPLTPCAISPIALLVRRAQLWQRPYVISVHGSALSPAPRVCRRPRALTCIRCKPRRRC